MKKAIKQYLGAVRFYIQETNPFVEIGFFLLAITFTILAERFWHYEMYMISIYHTLLLVFVFERLIEYVMRRYSEIRSEKVYEMLNRAEVNSTALGVDLGRIKDISLHHPRGSVHEVMAVVTTVSERSIVTTTGEDAIALEKAWREYKKSTEGEG